MYTIYKRPLLVGKYILHSIRPTDNGFNGSNGVAQADLIESVVLWHFVEKKNQYTQTMCIFVNGAAYFTTG